MIKKILYVILYTAIILIVGIVIGCLSCNPKPEKMTVKIEGISLRTSFDVVKATQKLLDTDAWPKHYVIRTLHDTIPIGPETPYGDVPVTETSCDTSLVLTVRTDKKYEVKVDISQVITHKGRLFFHDLKFNPTEFTLDVPGEKVFKLWGRIGGGYFNNGKIPVATEIGLLYKKRVSPSVMIMHIDDWHYGGMLWVWF